MNIERNGVTIPFALKAVGKRGKNPNVGAKYLAPNYNIPTDDKNLPDYQSALLALADFIGWEESHTVLLTEYSAQCRRWYDTVKPQDMETEFPKLVVAGDARGANIQLETLVTRAQQAVKQAKTTGDKALIVAALKEWQMLQARYEAEQMAFLADLDSTPATSEEKEEA